MSKKKDFERKLHALFESRTHKILSIIGKAKPGKPKDADGKAVKKKIDGLTKLAEEILIKTKAKKEFDRLLKGRKQKQIYIDKSKGISIAKKKKEFTEKYNKYIKNPNCVYAFWDAKDPKNKKCIYVGRTTIGAERPASHFEKRWFPQVTYVYLYPNPKSHLAKLECLATHLFNPVKKEKKPANKKYWQGCPVCEGVEYIREELSKIF